MYNTTHNTQTLQNSHLLKVVATLGFCRYIPLNQKDKFKQINRSETLKYFQFLHYYLLQADTPIESKDSVYEGRERKMV